MIRSSPGIGDGIRPNCEVGGHLLDANGARLPSTPGTASRSRIRASASSRSGTRPACAAHMRNFAIWTCGQTTSRLKDTTLRHDDGSYQPLSAQHVFEDYQFSVDDKIALPESGVRRRLIPQPAPIRSSHEKPPWLCPAVFASVRRGSGRVHAVAALDLGGRGRGQEGDQRPRRFGLHRGAGQSG